MTAFEEDKKRVLDYIQGGIYHSRCEEELEAFFTLIDELEEKAQAEPEYFSLICDCYVQMQDMRRAREAFLKIYDSGSKKDLKKLYDLEHKRHRPVTRPSRRVKKIQKFRYADKKVLSPLFIVAGGTPCSICGSTSAALYAGPAYGAYMEELSFADFPDKFCAKCISDGSAAKSYHLTFQHPFLEKLRKISPDKREELLCRTPGCGQAFDHNENIWPVCCGDFCRYVCQKEDEFHFQCLSCGGKLVWKA